MKKRNILFIVAALFLGSFMIVQFRCRKDRAVEPIPPIQPVYTDGFGEIGSIGGTVMIDDPGSPIDGASIEIPQGALDETLSIEIKQPDSNYYINGDHIHMIIDIKPSGVNFKKDVIIGIPYTAYSDENYFRAFHFNPEGNLLEELNLVDINKVNKIFYCQTEQTGLYFCDEMAMDIELVKVNDGGNTRLAAVAQISSLFENIPTGWDYTLNGYPNALSVLYSDYVPGVGSNYKVSLFEKGTGTSVDEVELEILISQTTSGNEIAAVQVGEWKDNVFSLIYQQGLLDKDVIANTWMRGFPLLFVFKGFEPNSSDKYYAKVSWVVGKRNSSHVIIDTFTDFYTLGMKYNAVQLAEMRLVDGDADLNFVLDDYENSNGFAPPYPPVKESPSQGAENVSTSTDLNWSCYHPEHFPMHYEIYFGPVNTPPRVEQNYLQTTYDPGKLEKFKMYFWRIVAFDDHNNSTEGPLWCFMTGDGNGKPPNVELLTPSGIERGNIKINFTITDENGNENNLAVGYQCPAVGSHPATLLYSSAGLIVGSVIKYIPPGDHYFIWDSSPDFPCNHTDDMKINMIWKDTLDFESETFKVDNTNCFAFTDPRDEQVYNATLVGNQVWMAENLNYATDHSWWYNNSRYNGELYGRLYTWDAAQTACPPGWHLPSDEEWKVLAGNADTQYGVHDPIWDHVSWRGYDAGKRLKDEYSWIENTGTDAFGFAGLAGGERGSSFMSLSVFGRWWSATESGSTNAVTMGLSFEFDEAGQHWAHKACAFSVRCVRD